MVCAVLLPGKLIASPMVSNSMFNFSSFSTNG